MAVVYMPFSILPAFFIKSISWQIYGDSINPRLAREFLLVPSLFDVRCALISRAQSWKMSLCGCTSHSFFAFEIRKLIVVNHEHHLVFLR